MTARANIKGGNPKCQCGEEKAPRARKCKACHATYMREWRKSHPLTTAQRRKDNCRSYTRMLVKRGHLVKEPCHCGEAKVEAHHPDYDDPRSVVWLCRKHHREHHAKP